MFDLNKAYAAAVRLLARRSGADCDGQLRAGGHFRFEIETAAGEVRERGLVKNGITTAALDLILNDWFRSGTPPSAFYVGLINAVSFGGVAGSDTMASHANWTELTDYSQAARVTWAPAASTARKLTTASPLTFSINAADKQIAGIFVTTNNTKGGTTGTLWATGVLRQQKALNSGESLKVWYDLTASGY